MTLNTPPDQEQPDLWYTQNDLDREYSRGFETGTWTGAGGGVLVVILLLLLALHSYNGMLSSP